jgi:hypothetical protein
MMSFVASKTYYFFQWGKKKREEKKRLEVDQKSERACCENEERARGGERERRGGERGGGGGGGKEKIPVRLRRRDRTREWTSERNSLCGSESLMEIEMAARMSCAGPVNGLGLRV